MKYLIDVVLKGSKRMIRMRIPGSLFKSDGTEDLAEALDVDGYLEINKATGCLTYTPRNEPGATEPPSILRHRTGMASVTSPKFRAYRDHMAKMRSIKIEQRKFQ